MLKTGNWVRYCIFDLATGKAEQENNFPTSNLAFLGQNERNVAIFTAGQVRQAIEDQHVFTTRCTNIYPMLHFKCLIFNFYQGVSHHPPRWKWHNLPYGQRLHGWNSRS